jgi:hypothetical protein
LLAYSSDSLSSGDLITVDFLGKDASGLDIVITQVATFTNNAITFSMPMTLADSKKLRLARSEYLNVKKAGVLVGGIRVLIRSKKEGFGKNPCNHTNPINQPSKDLIGTCDDLLYLVDVSTGIKIPVDKGDSVTFVGAKISEIDGNLVVNFDVPPPQIVSFNSETITIEEGYFTALNQLGDEEYFTLQKPVTIAKTRLYTNKPVSVDTTINLLKNGVVVATFTLLAGQKNTINTTSYGLVNGDNLQINFISGDTQVKFATNSAGTIN